MDVVESVARSLVSRRPDVPFVGSGLRTELTHHGLRARRTSTRADSIHHLLDPLVVAGPWVIGAWGVACAVRRVRGSRRGH